MNFWAHLKFPGMNFSTTPGAVTDAGAGAGGGSGAGSGGGTPSGTGGGTPAGGQGGQPSGSPVAGTSGQPAESPNVRQLREQYEALKSKYEPWEKLGVQPTQVTQYQQGYQQVFNTAKEIADNLGYEEADLQAAIQQHGLVATLDFLRNEAFEAEQAEAGNQDVQFRRDMQQQIQEQVNQALTPIQQRENIRMTQNANATFERTVHQLIVSDMKQLGIDAGAISPDEMEMLVAGTSEVMQYEPDDIKALKFEGKTAGVQKAYQTFKTMLDKYYLARNTRETQRAGDPNNRGRRAPDQQGGQGGSQGGRRPSLDEMIEDPSRINPKYA